ncbi:MAG: ATP-binding cassette domain-containing protein [Nitriliruptorales bacterium]|nr:ATP-binding cassette domain-containing protein [Nitriliruptorales bacterium]
MSDTTTVDTDGAIRAHEVTKQFRGGVVALESVSMSIREREFSAVIGPSGCGKSTLLRLIAGLIPATSGVVTIDGERVTGPRPDVTMMFQKPTLLPWKDALGNALLPQTINGSATSEAKKKALGLLYLLGLQGFEYHYPRHLSGGMEQRVALARLLMVGAKFVLLDEPFGALDEFTRERLNLELMSLHASAHLTTMLVTHNISEAILLSDRVIVMTDRPGKIAGVVDVPFERPRAIELQRRPEFNELMFEVRDLLGEALR